MKSSIEIKEIEAPKPPQKIPENKEEIEQALRDTITEMLTVQLSHSVEYDSNKGAYILTVATDSGKVERSFKAPERLPGATVRKTVWAALRQAVENELREM